MNPVSLFQRNHGRSFLAATRRAGHAWLVFGLGALAWPAAGVAAGPVQKLAISTVAGVAPGRANATGSAARFWGPAGIAVGPDGTVYVADSGNHTVRKVTPAGTVSTWIGRADTWGDEDGPASTALVGSVAGLACDAVGNLYLCDWNTIRKVSPQGVVGPLPGLKHAFQSTRGVARDKSGNLYVCDQQDGTIWKVSASGAARKIAGVSGALGFLNGAAASSQFFLPGGIAVDAAGNVYVADTGNYVIRRITPAGRVSTFAGAAGEQDNVDGKGAAARFWLPTDVAIDPAGVLYVVDSGANRIRRIAPDGTVTTLAGSIEAGSADGMGAAARFSAPSYLAVGSGGTIYVSDSGNNTVRKIAAGGAVKTLAGKASVGATNGSGRSARFHLPGGLARDAAGNLYVADQLNNVIRKITPAGVVSTVAGVADGKIAYLDGPARTARFYWPTQVAVAADGTLYVSDTMNNVIRRITTAGMVETYAGVGLPPTGGGVGEQTPGGSKDGAANQARFYGPRGLVLNAAGDLFVADQQNNTIRKITRQGVVSTLAGTAGKRGSADGVGSAARFYWPTGLTIDAAGNLYVSDLNNTIRKITPAGKVTTLAGTAGTFTGLGSPTTGAGSADGQGAQAHFKAPTGLAVDATGNVFVADFGNNTIRVITPSGVVSTLAGYAGLNGYGATEAGSSGYSDGRDGAARMNGPNGLVLDSQGNLYFTDSNNNTVRMGVPVNHPPVISDIPGQATRKNTPTKPVSFIIGDLETPVAQLKLTRASSNSQLLPVANIVLAGSGSKWTVTLKPVTGKTGTSKITLKVSDGVLTSSATFVLTVK